jgi:hypothetical protein
LGTPDWLHEVKYDGYRLWLWLERDGDRACDWTDHGSARDSRGLSTSFSRMR